MQEDVSKSNQSVSDRMEAAMEKHLPAEVKYIIPENKVDDVKAYAALLRKKHPHISQHRLMKKVAAYYHLETN